MNVYTQTLINLNLVLAVMLTGLSIIVLVDPYIDKRQRRDMMLVALFVLSIIVSNQMEGVITSPGETSRRIVTFLAAYGYSVRPVILALMVSIIGKGQNIRKAWAMVSVNGVIYLISCFTGLAFRIDQDLKFTSTPFNYSCIIVSSLLLTLLMWEGIKTYWNSRRLEALLPFGSAALIIGATIVDFNMAYNPPVTFLNAAITCCCVLYYLWLHLQFARDHEEALHAEQRIRIMVSQIQPHFLFNTLSTIQALIETDPDKASDTIEKFGTYLRQNIKSLDQQTIVPIDKEIEHTRTYADIELIRFPSIRVEYDIRDHGFKVPPLSVQPLVENAIRHGVRGRRDGYVSVLTYSEEGEHVIVVQDNGRGFDINAQLSKDRDHIGIRNVRERIEGMCDGTMTIESKIDEGTRVTIRIPA